MARSRDQVCASSIGHVRLLAAIYGTSISAQQIIEQKLVLCYGNIIRWSI